MTNAQTPDKAAGTTPRQQDNYDPHITPAETAARQEREGQNFKHIPNESDKPGANSESVHTTDGYTTDKEGLLNNFAVEPEMYVNEPGDLRQEEQQDEARRAEELEEVNDTDKDGELTMDHDNRGKGTGII